ncbi:GGDEF domain-containing protein [Lichenicola sp.]|uniref:GGDEF domain-containing protein n=1 Tax=Lichenicola sp. TaxID=2804529 RepID=UPI003AFF8FF8
MNDFLAGDAAWRQLVDTVKGYAFVLLDRDGTVVGWNDGAKAMKFYDSIEIIGRNFREFYTPESQLIGHPERELTTALSVGRHEEEGWRVRKGGSRFWAHVTITSIHDDNGLHCGFGKIVRDLTEQKQSQEQYANVVKLLEQTALTDFLTGLDNRRSLDRMLTATIAGAQRRGRGLSLAMIDFDHFKQYNDEFGHQNADIYLKRAVNGWRASLRSEDLLARYGGEEFVVVMPDTPSAAAIRCMERLRAATPAPMTCSVGVAEWHFGESPNALIGRADRAMYRAKADGRNRLVVAPDPEHARH